MYRFKLASQTEWFSDRALEKCAEEIERRFVECSAIVRTWEPGIIVGNSPYADMLREEDRTTPIVCDLSKRELSLLTRESAYYFTWLAIAVLKDPALDQDFSGLYAEGNPLLYGPPFSNAVPGSIIEIYLTDEGAFIVQTQDLGFARTIPPMLCGMGNLVSEAEPLP